MAVGVITPVHGFAPYLAEALDAVLAERPDVVVVVDDGSDPAIVVHPDQAPHITLVRRERAGGPAAARAAGLAALPSDVDVVALCDADDAWDPGSLAPRLAGARATGWSFGRAHVVGPDGRATGERWAEPAPGAHDAAAFARSLYAHNPVPTSTVVLRRDALERAGGFEGPVRVAEDWELWLRLCRTGAAPTCVADAVVRYRRHPGGLTADVACLARAQLVVHEQHRDLVDPATAERALADDHAALAAGLARDGDLRGARIAWAAAAHHRRLTPGERARRAALAVPVLRGRLGRRTPY